MAQNINPKKGPLVFVLDDDPTIHHLIKSFFYQGRPDVTTRGFVRLDDMVVARDLLAVDLFVVDINLAPDLSGFDVPSLLPATCRMAAFLFCSGFNVDLDAYNRARFLPLFDFLAKPFGDVQFLHRVEMLLAARFAVPVGIDDRLFSMLSAAPFLGVVIDGAGQIRLVNQAAADYMDLPLPRQAKGRPIGDFIADYNQVPAAKKEFYATIKSDAGINHPMRWLRTPFLEMDKDQATLLVGIPTATWRRKADRLREVYQEIITRDRTAIRAIKTMKPPAATAGQGAH